MFPTYSIILTQVGILYNLCTYHCKAGGEGGCGAWVGDLIVFVGPGEGHLTDLVLRGRGYLNLSSPDVRF